MQTTLATHSMHTIHWRQHKLLTPLHLRTFLQFLTPCPQGTYVAYTPSVEVMECIEGLSDRAENLDDVQASHGLSFPVSLDSGICGLVEAWAEGEEWNALMANTSLDPGDVFRILRRTVELLRQVRITGVRMYFSSLDVRTEQSDV